MKDAVVEAAKVAVKEHFARWGMASTAPGTIALNESVRALDACTQPDLDALNAAVAEAAESMVLRWESEGFHNLPSSPENTVRLAILARRAAMQPKPRYEALGNAWTIFDNHEQKFLLPPKVADLLNKEKP